MILVIPMAGRGARLKKMDQLLPKPLIQLNGKPIMHYAMEAYKDLKYTKAIFIVLREHEENFGISEEIKKFDPDGIIVYLDDVTDGQLCTVLEAQEYFNSDEDLLIGNIDSYIVAPQLAVNIAQRPEDCRGIISVIAAPPGNRWSFVKPDNNGNAIQVAEKVRISDYASTGIYYFSSASEFSAYAKTIISNKIMQNGEYYVIPVYQKYIDDNKIIRISVATDFNDLGSMEGIRQFEIAHKHL